MRRLTIRSMAVAIAAVAVAAVIPFASPAPSAEAAVTRVNGADRYEVSVRLSQQNPDPGRVVYLVSGTKFPDALAAGPVAAAEGAHMLLTQPDSIPRVIADRIRALAPAEIVIVGGTASIAPAVESAARQLAPTVTRIAGTDRVANSFLLLDRMIAKGLAPSEVWVVSGGSFADALSAGAIAARDGHGLVLTYGAAGGFQQSLFDRLGSVREIHIAGGTASVSYELGAWMGTHRPTDRFGGANRFEVAVNVNREFTGSATQRTMMLANGNDFPDGLGAAVLAGARGMPLYLTPPQCRGTAGVSSEVTRLGIQNTIVVGGPRSVSDAAARLEACPDIPAIQGQVIAIVNQHRANVSLPPLYGNTGLQSMAQSWSGSMAAQQSMVHSSTFCTQTFDMGFRRCAENIARTGSPSAQGVMDLWMNSAGHRANILNPNLTSIGVGLVQGSDGRWYWTQNFGGY